MLSDIRSVHVTRTGGCGSGSATACTTLSTTHVKALAVQYQLGTSVRRAITAAGRKLSGRDSADNQDAVSLLHSASRRC